MTVAGALVAGLLGSAHCMGMCGGIAGAAGLAGITGVLLNLMPPRPQR
jgi:sulfite exporter TauE/SafE